MARNLQFIQSIANHSSALPSGSFCPTIPMAYSCESRNSRMKATLYEALGISPTSSDEDVRAALRRLIRKYYAKTRDGQGNVEEALRFINHASRILSDTDRRAALRRRARALDRATTEQRIAHVVNAGAARRRRAYRRRRGAPVPGDVEASTSRSIRICRARRAARRATASSGTDRARRVVRPLAARSRSACARSSARSSRRRSCSSRRPTRSSSRKQVLVWLTAALAGARRSSMASCTALVVRAPPARRARARRCMPQTDLAILNWRREKSVFLGTNQPQEDASWIFQLRMAELERAKSGRTSEPRPWHRLAARMFDYAIWGLVLALLLSRAARARLRCPTALAYWLDASAARADAHHRDVDADRGAADRVGRHDAGQVAVRHLPAVLDLRCVCAPRHARAADARAASARSACGGKASAAASRCSRRCSIAVAYEKLAAEPGNRLGLRARIASSRTGRPACQHGHRRVRARGDDVALRRRVAAADGRFDRVDAHDDRGGAAVVVDRQDQAQRAHPASSTSCCRRCRRYRPSSRRSRLPAQRLAPFHLARAGNAAPSSRDAVAKGAGTDAGFEAAIAERRARIEVLKSEGPRILARR